MSSTKMVTYFRVSTDRQGRSGLGLDAQRQAVTTYLGNGQWEVVGEFVEVESGRNNDRPRLADALAICRKKKATLVIAKLDRLSRNLAFTANLMEAGVDFVATDMPHANKTMLQMMAVFAEHEREMISKRTKEALAAAKQRGVKLGSPNPRKGSTIGNAVKSARADQFATNIHPIIGEIQSAGITTLRGIAAALDARGICAPRGGYWKPTSVRRVMLQKSLS
ncbi:recombinase family protein [Magnetospira sp. QH-2]|uniref:recombinase family protein n=1 Tax=Magnetospira sp. (strain QH-2) TaxID=1288970 RepID=UPI0003E81B4E|nr:recombinase family protein [Magnetospira sp. QH-2]CCQ72411.1 Site-specific recombinase (resolvase) [Magnetospira sp. QH-2]